MQLLRHLFTMPTERGKTFALLDLGKKETELKACPPPRSGTVSPGLGRGQFFARSPGAVQIVATLPFDVGPWDRAESLPNPLIFGSAAAGSFPARLSNACQNKHLKPPY
jgi:hypothetical protein